MATSTNLKLKMKDAALSDKKMLGSEPPKNRRLMIKILFVLLVLGFLLLAIISSIYYFDFFEAKKIADEHKLKEYPVVGTLIQQLDRQAVQEEHMNYPEPSASTVTAAKPAVVEKEANSVMLEVEREKLEKDKLAAEQKKISKLARLYGAMKPEEAIPILNKLDDNLVLAILGKMEDDQVAQLLAKMDSGRSARLTQAMYTAKQP